MLKFFRFIRQDIISNGKTSKYFKYALGEIILVMIGILLALQVSNWKDQHNERQLEKRYVSELILDLKTDSVTISHFLKQSDLQLSYKIKLLDYIAGTTNINEDSLSIYFNRQWIFSYNFNPITTTLDEMKSTGNIGAIQNSSLRRKILESYKNYNVFINEPQKIYLRQQEELWKVLFSKIPNLYNITNWSKEDEFITKNEQVKTALTNFEIQNRISGNYVAALNSELKNLQNLNNDLLIALTEEYQKLNK